MILEFLHFVLIVRKKIFKFDKFFLKYENFFGLFLQETKFPAHEKFIVVFFLRFVDFTCLHTQDKSKMCVFDEPIAVFAFTNITAAMKARYEMGNNEKFF